MTATEVLTPTTLGGLPISPVVEDTKYFNMLVYGASGVGKTVLAGSSVEVPELNPVIFLDIEGGTLSLRDRYPNVRKVRIASWDDLVEAYVALREGKIECGTLVLDSLTELQNFGMEEIMSRAVMKAQEEGEERDPDLPGIGEHGKSTERMRKIIRRFRDLPMNTIFTSLDRTDVDKKGRKSIKPLLSPKLADQVAGFLDVVVYMYKVEDDGQIKRVICTMATDEVTAKDRTDRLPPVMEDPTMSAIYQDAMGKAA